MVAGDGIASMYDLELKPRLLRSLLRDYVPDEKHPFQDPSELSYVVSAVKTHNLLSEEVPPSADPKLIESWKSAVDSWVKRLLTLASSNLPDKCWAGVCLLGVTCRECSSERFLASHAVWFSKLLSHVQVADPHFAKAACCASLSDLFTRLAAFPNAKKDGTSQATKLVQPTLKLLSEDKSEVLWEEALCLLSTLLDFFPYCVQRHYENIEAAVVLKLMSEECSASILKKLGYVLSLLPRSRGDEDSWSIMMQKLSLSVNRQLDDAFQGLEEETRSNEVMRVLLPPGKEPPPLGGQATSKETSDLANRRPEHLLASRISALMHCCCTLLRGSYPVQVRVPVNGLVALAGRVLMVDGSLSRASYALMITMKQEFICSELPVLQLHSLDLLMAVIKAVHSQFLPYAANAIRLLTEYLRRCALPDLRIKVYSILKVLLMSMGVGIAIYLSQEVISNAFIDLDTAGPKSEATNSHTYSNFSVNAMPQSRQRKRKHASTTGALQEQSDRDGLNVEVLHNPTSVSVKIAALETLEALLTVGGSLRSESWRAKVDHLLITVATNACSGGWAKEEPSVFLSSNSTPLSVEFQMASLRTLLASLLSPGRVRSSHLGQGLDLFRRGMQEKGTRLASFCSHALLALEVLIHPRALPLVDLDCTTDNYGGSGIKFLENLYPNGQTRKPSFQTAVPQNGYGDPESDEEDDLIKKWTDNDEEMEVPLSDKQKTSNYMEVPSAEVSNHSIEKLPLADDISVRNAPEGSELRREAFGGSDDVMVDILQPENSNHHLGERVSTGGEVSVASDHHSAEPSRVVSESCQLDQMDSETALEEKDLAKTSNVTEKSDNVSISGRDKTVTKDDRYTKVVERTSNDELSDPFPDIVDVEPDSD